jgi:DNA-binding NarL/FixJ family response regulator
MDINKEPFDGEPLYPEEVWVKIANHKKIPPRELQVGRLIFIGDKDLAITEKLQLSPHTVRTYRRRFYRRFGVRNARDVCIRICQFAQTLI